MYSVFITDKNIRQDITVICSDSIEVSSERQGSPAKMTFSVVTEALTKDEVKINEGDTVEFYVNNYPMFKGFIFGQSKGLDGTISITAYDQLRYFKNKDTYVYENKKASEILKMIAKDFNIKLGEVEDTGYVIGSRTEDGCTLFDIVITALELTLYASKKMYVMYDDFGKVILKNIQSMKSELMIADDETLMDFDYKTDIDSDTYNQIKLYRDNEETGKREIYMAKDSSNINKWGLLQYYEQAESSMNEAQINDYMLRWLKQKNRVKKTLKITCIGIGIGEEKLRGGSIVYIEISKLGIGNWFVCESVSHTFNNNQHEISITVYDF